MAKVRSESRQESSRANANQLARNQNLPIQKKVAIGKSGDKYEQEADQIADQVVNNKKVDIKQPERKKEEQPLQKKEDEKEKPVKGIQKKEAEEKEESPQEEIQKKEEKEPTQTDGGARNDITNRLKNSKGKGHPLPSDTLRSMESQMGGDFSGVRIHTGPEAAQLNRDVGAQAFTHDQDIYFNEGKYNPNSSEGKWLLAHELTHTIQQGGGSKPTIQRKESTETNVAAPQSTTPLNTAQFQPGLDVSSYLENKGNSGGNIKVGLGSFASGSIKVRKTGENTFDTVGKRENIPLNVDFLKPLEGIGQPVLGVKIRKNKITGYATLKVGNKVFQNPNVILDKMRANSEAMGWFGMDKIRIPKSITNEIKNGQLHFGSENIKVRVGGFIDANLKLGLINDNPIFEVDSTIKVPKLKPVQLSIKRDKAGRMSGRAAAEVDIANFNGAIDVKYLDGIVDIKGVVGYDTEKMRGKIHILVTDLATAKNAALQELGPENIVQSKAKNTGEKEGKPKPKTGPRALAGWGDVEFSFTDWMTGRAKVVVDHEGHITVYGEMTPPNEVELFPQKDIIRPIFAWELRATYGIPLLGSAFFFAKIGMDAMAKIGPGKLYNIKVIGRYSTNPRVFKAFTIQGTMNISAFAGARIRAEGGVGISIIAHDVKVGVGVEALAGIRGYVDATPTIGYREKADPKAGKKGEYFIKGYMEIAAQPFLGLGGDLFVELDAPWWSPIFDKKWTWPLGDIEYPLPGEFAMGANLDYTIGSDSLPEIQFDEIEFDKDKFMSDLMDDKMPKKKGDREDKKGKFSDGKKKPGLNKPKVKGGAGKKGEPKPKQEDGKPLTKAEMKAWGKGLEKLKDIAEESKSKPLDEESINAKLQKVKGFDSVKAEPQGQEWKIKAKKGSMTNKKSPILVKGIIPPESKDAKVDGKSDKAKMLSSIKETFLDERDDQTHTIKFVKEGSTVTPKIFSNATHIPTFLNGLPQSEEVEKTRKVHQRILELTRKELDEKGVKLLNKNVYILSQRLLRLTDIDYGELPSPKYNFEMSDGKAYIAKVEYLSAKRGSGTGPGGFVKGWKHLQQGLSKSSEGWRRLHLINDNFGGLGVSSNLVPGTRQNNSDHLKKFENPIKKKIGAKASNKIEVDKEGNPRNNVVSLEAKVHYDHGKGPIPDKFKPPIIDGEKPKREWYASKIEFASKKYEFDNNKKKWEKNETRDAVPSMTLEIDLPDWTKK